MAHSLLLSDASSAPAPIFLQSDRVRRRIAASDSVASLVAELCFGTPRRDDVTTLHFTSTARVASYAEARG